MVLAALALTPVLCTDPCHAYAATERPDPAVTSARTSKSHAADSEADAKLACVQIERDEMHAQMAHEQHYMHMHMRAESKVRCMHADSAQANHMPPIVIPTPNL